MFSTNSIYHIELPAWIKRAFILYQQMNNYFDNFKYLFCTNLSTNLQNALYTELSDLYRGIHFQQKSLMRSNLSCKSKYFLKSEIHLLSL